MQSGWFKCRFLCHWFNQTCSSVNMFTLWCVFYSVVLSTTAASFLGQNHSVVFFFFSSVQSVHPSSYLGSRRTSRGPSVCSPWCFLLWVVLFTVSVFDQDTSLLLLSSAPSSALVPVPRHMPSHVWAVIFRGGKGLTLGTRVQVLWEE